MPLRVSIRTLLVLIALFSVILVFRDRVENLILRNLLMSLVVAFSCGFLFTVRFRRRGFVIPLLLAFPAILSAVYAFLAANLILDPEEFVWTRQLPGLFSITDSVVNFACTSVYSSPETGGLWAALLIFTAIALLASLMLGGLAGMALAPKIVG